MSLAGLDLHAKHSMGNFPMLQPEEGRLIWLSGLWQPESQIMHWQRVLGKRQADSHSKMEMGIRKGQETGRMSRSSRPLSSLSLFQRQEENAFHTPGSASPRKRRERARQLLTFG